MVIAPSSVIWILSILAPLAGSDFVPYKMSSYPFLSILAPLAGSDTTPTVAPTGLRSFNPRSPCGERHLRETGRPILVSFQSSLPLRGATAARAVPALQAAFNPRSPCGERRTNKPIMASFVHFQSSLPLRGATHTVTDDALAASLSILAPLAGSDSTTFSEGRLVTFQSSLPLRGATAHGRDLAHSREAFNPRSPCGERRTAACSRL